MADVYSLYPGPSKNVLADPAGAVNLFHNITALQGAQRELAGRTATGDAFQNALRPDGTIDQDALTAGLKSNPAAAYTLPETMSRVLAQRGQQIGNVTAQFNQSVAQNGFLMDRLGSLADLPNPTKDDVRNFVVTASRNTGVPSPMLNAWVDTLPSDSQGLKSALSNFRNQAIGSTGLSTRVQGPPTPGGAPTTISTGQANISGPQGIPTAPVPGFSERQVGGAAIDTRLAGGLADAAEGSQGRRALLGNLDNLISGFTPGPGADWTKVAKSFVNRNVPLPASWGSVFDPKSIASQEEFNKQAMQLAQQQFQTIGGTGTDAKFSSAFETSPNEALSSLGNKGIIRLLKGNEDAIQAKNEAWLKASAADPNMSYRQFSAAFNTNFDPRAYQFKYMSKEERQAAYDAMNPEEQKRFLSAVKFARDRGYVGY